MLIVGDVHYNGRGLVFIPEAWLWVLVEQDWLQKLGKEDKTFLNHDNLDFNLPFLWSSTCFLHVSLSLPMEPIPLIWRCHLTWLMATLVSRSCWIFRLSLDKFWPRGLSFSIQILVSAGVANGRKRKCLIMSLENNGEIVTDFGRPKDMITNFYK